MPLAGTTTPFLAPAVEKAREHFDELVEELLDDALADLSGWYCVKTDDWPCPAEGCSFVARHLTAAHRIVVWASIDDNWLLRHCADAKQHGRNPRIVEYEQSLGPCIAYDEWVAIGRPVHGLMERPGHRPFNAF